MFFRRYKGVICLAAAYLLIIIVNLFAANAFETVSVSNAVLVPSPEVHVSDSDKKSNTQTSASQPVETSATQTSATEPRKDKPKSDSPYIIVVYLKSQSVIVYRADSKGNKGVIVKQCTCSSGAPYSPTPTGEYAIGSKYRWRLLQGEVYGQFCSRIGGNILFHSTPFLTEDPSTLKDDEYDKLGRAVSMGCIRMCVRDCKWIYDNAPKGTPVSIVNEKGPYGFKPPKRKSDPIYSGWDPSDKWAKNNPYFNEIHTESSQSSDSTTTVKPSETTNGKPSDTTTAKSSETSASTSASSSTTT